MSAMTIPLCVSFVYCVVFNLEMEAVPVVHFGNRHSFPADTHRQKTVPADNSDLGSSVEEQNGSVTGRPPGCAWFCGFPCGALEAGAPWV